MGPDEYVIASTKIDVELRRADGSDIGVAWAEQGHFANGKWIEERDAAVESNGTSVKLKFSTANGRYGQLRLALRARASGLPLGFFQAREGSSGGQTT